MAWLKLRHDPAIKRLYPLKEDQVAALKRHLVFFNTTPAVCGPVLGVTAAMEDARQRRGHRRWGDQRHQSGLMGPLAGVGDPLVWGTLRPDYRGTRRVAGTRNILGPLLFFFIFNAVRLVRMVRPAACFRKGVNIVSDMGGTCCKTDRRGLYFRSVRDGRAGHQVDLHPRAAGSVANARADGTTVTMTVQNILDQLCPGLLALGLTLLMVRLSQKLTRYG